MAIDRRSFLAGLGAAVAANLAGRVARAGTEPIYVSACTGPDGVPQVAVFSEDGILRFTTRLPARGHDIARRPGSRDLVVFARRPGDWAAVVDAGTGNVSRVVLAPAGRHFFGHGVFSADGAILYATENRIETGQGVLGVYDARADYARIGEMPTSGPGPHDLAFLPGHEHVVVANGGTRTQPGTGREILNKDTMEPSLARVRVGTGETESRVDLGRDLKGLSIRHLAVAPDGEVAFGCQLVGDPEAVVPLVGLLDRAGRPVLLEMPEDDLISLDNYIGSVSLDCSGTILAATSPQGNVVAFWDRASRRYLGRRRLSDVCGVAATGRDGVFLLSSGNAGVGLVELGRRDVERVGEDLRRWVWDNHMRRLG